MAGKYLKDAGLVWTAVGAAVLAVAAILTAMSYPSLSLSFGLAAVASAVLSLRE